ncbi:MAG TPA: hypothetical protein VJT09_18005 [Pyrinomonadaceae bacterium]|nr:hypothetical protein [Pyrinomonadaceae bacterium]
MFTRGSILSLKNCKIVSACLLALILLTGAAAAGQKTKPTLWYYPWSGHETGKLSDIKDKRKVYVMFFLGRVLPQDPLRTSYQQRIRNLLTRDGELELVERPEDAELAVYISSQDDALYEFYVLTRGEPQKDGGYKPRVVLKRLRSESMGSTALIEQAVSAFVDDLKAARGK